jgi:arginyl-tRNA synthetase
MSKDEQEAHAKMLTRNFASELKPFKLYYTNRPINLQRNQDYQAFLMEKEKNALKFNLQEKRSRSFGNLSVTGKALETEIYLIIWEKDTEYVEQELMKRLNDLKLKFTNCGYRSEILDEKMIIQLVNSYTNPDVAYIEDQEYLQIPPRV